MKPEDEVYSKRYETVKEKTRRYKREEEVRRRLERIKVNAGENFQETNKYCYLEALKYYNEKNNSDFVLVKMVEANEFYMVECDRGLIHMNFTAKKPNENDDDAVRFFAELEIHSSSSQSVLVCIILDGIETQTFCIRCHPEAQCKHPVHGFDPQADGPYAEWDLSSDWYLSSSDEEGVRYIK